jgi:hypothetical protein
MSDWSGVGANLMQSRNGFTNVFRNQRSKCSNERMRSALRSPAPGASLYRTSVGKGADAGLRAQPPAGAEERRCCDVI